MERLTDEQRVFAEQNHNLIYAFLNKRGLRDDEYYDVAVFGYLRAVQRYLTKSELRKHCFSTIAFWEMRHEVYMAHVYNNRLMRKGILYSLDDERLKDSALLNNCLADEGSEDTVHNAVEGRLLWQDMKGLLTEEQLALVRKLTMGIPKAEIARQNKVPVKRIDVVVADIRVKVSGMIMSGYHGATRRIRIASEQYTAAGYERIAA